MTGIRSALVLALLVGGCRAGDCSDDKCVHFGVDAPPMAPAMLAVSPATQSLVPTFVGGPPQTVELTVTDIGGSPTGMIQVSSSTTQDFAVISSCSSLVAASFCVVSTTFTPNHAGSFTAGVTASADPGGTVVATLSGTVAPNNLAISPATLELANTPIGQTSLQLVATFTNTDAAATAVLAVDSTNAVFARHADTCSGNALPSGASCTVAVNYTPTGTVMTNTDGDRGTLTVTGVPGSFAQVGLHGTGYTLGITPPPTNGAYLFPSAPIGAVSSMTLTITNAYTQPIGPLATSLLYDIRDFSITSDDCRGTSLAPAEGCAITVAFTKPSDNIYKQALLDVSGPDIGMLHNEVVATLVGNGP